MACSLRVDTVSDLQYSQFEQRSTPEGDHWVCNVMGKDSTDREAETRPRAVFIPDDIMSQVESYAKRKRLDDDDLLFPHSTRTIQRDVKRSAENAATATGDLNFLKVSSHDLRRYFATHLLFRHEVPPPVVRVLGGWKSDDAMFEYLVLPDDVLFERLGEAGLLGTGYDTLGRHDHVEKIVATTARLADLISEADASQIESATGQMNVVFEDIEAITVDFETDEDVAPEEESDADQMSFQRFDFDEGAVAYPVGLLMVGYYTSVVLFSWSLTFGAAG